MELFSQKSSILDVWLVLTTSLILLSFVTLFKLPTEYIKTILKAFVKFAGALCPFAGGYFKKQTSGRVADWDRDNLFSTFAKFSEKLTFLTPRYALGAAKFLMKKAIPLLSFSLHFFHHFLIETSNSCVPVSAKIYYYQSCE